MVQFNFLSLSVWLVLFISSTSMLFCYLLLEYYSKHILLAALCTVYISHKPMYCTSFALAQAELGIRLCPNLCKTLITDMHVHKLTALLWLITAPVQVHVVWYSTLCKGSLMRYMLCCDKTLKQTVNYINKSSVFFLA